MNMDEVAAIPIADIANEVPADDNPEEANASQTEEQSEEQTNTSRASKGSRNFTQEERATITELAKEVDAAKVAREICVSARLIYYWLHQEKKKSSSPFEQPAAAGYEHNTPVISQGLKMSVEKTSQCCGLLPFLASGCSATQRA